MKTRSNPPSKKTHISRRKFIARTGMAAAGSTLAVHTLGAGSRIPRAAQDKIRMGFIGVGNRGSQLMGQFMAQPDVEVAALCDVYQPYLSRDRSAVHPLFIEMGRVPQMGEDLGPQVRFYSDFRSMLKQDEIDAVCIATPDHWHAIQAIQAMEAGKDVYVEKPLTITIREGREMVKAQQRTGQVCAVGLNRRGAHVFQKLTPEILNGKIGKITSARAFRISNMYPDGIGRMMPEEPPEGFNWDMWLGPRAYRDYQYNIAPYKFRWWSEYSSQMGNWGVHYMDVIRWMMGEDAPVAITAHGGKYAVMDDRDIPDTMEVLFEFDSGSMIQFSIHEASGEGGIQGGEVELNGTKGTLVADENSYTIRPSRPGQFQQWESQVEEEEYSLENELEAGNQEIIRNSTASLVRNFLDCVRSREEPYCNLENGHRSTSFAHLANISLAMGMRIEWDPAGERITNSDAANELLHYDYREPWTL